MRFPTSPRYFYLTISSTQICFILPQSSNLRAICNSYTCNCALDRLSQKFLDVLVAEFAGVTRKFLAFENTDGNQHPKKSTHEKVIRQFIPTKFVSFCIMIFLFLSVLPTS